MKEYIQKKNTLRLLLMYSQFADMPDVVFAFNILQDKDFEKSVYITKAIHYYDRTENESLELAEAFFPIRCMSFIKSFYNLKTKEDVKNLLEKGLNSAVFKNASDRMLKNETPRPSLLGFNKEDADAKEMHNRLFQMDVCPRIALISTAIKKYVMDGQDSAALMACSYQLVHDSMVQYSTAKNKEAVVKTFYSLMQQTKSLS